MAYSTGSSPARAGLWYAAVILLVTAASVLILENPILVKRGAFVIYLGVVALVTWFGGWRAGLFSIVLTAIALAWFILPPTTSLAIGNPDDWIRLGVYLLVAGVIAMLHASRDRARKNAWDTEQRLAFALKCANYGVWYSDLVTGKFWWSDEVASLFGRVPGDFSETYEAFIAYIHPDDRDFVERAVTRTVEGGTEFEIEHRIVRPDGEVRRLFTRGKIIKDENARGKQLIGIVMDITHRGPSEGSAGERAGGEKLNEE